MTGWKSVLLENTDLEQLAVASGTLNQLVDQQLLGELWEFVSANLSEEEAYVAVFRWRLGWSLNETATALGLTKAKVMTREKNAFAAIRARFGHDS